jgi:hypothetical protein
MHPDGLAAASRACITESVTTAASEIIGAIPTTGPRNAMPMVR